MPRTRKLARAFYLNPDVIGIARTLIGKHLFTHIEGALTVILILADKHILYTI